MTQTASTAAAGNGTRAASAPLVLVGAESGITLIPSPTPLTRLNYFDGKFLRADDLGREQDYLRRLVELSNQAGGSGIVHGFNLLRGAGAGLVLTAGMAVDPRGRVLYLPFDATIDLAQLLQRSRSAPTPGTGSGSGGAAGFAECETVAVGAQPVTAEVEEDLFLVTVTHAEALCGEEDVYGKLCEEACVTSTNRPYRLEGVVVRAVPLALAPAACTADFLTRAHRRSQVAAAYFADERARLGRAMSGARLRQEVWCRGATAETGDAVAVAVVSLSGGAVEFVDAWTARRERMEAPPLRYWQWQTGLRPEAVFWAQLLQFQCHLRDVLAGAPAPGGEDDPCADQLRLLRQTRKVLEEMEARFGQALGSGRDARTLRGEGDFTPQSLVSVAELKRQVVAKLTQLEDGGASQQRMLIDAGIVEIPPAGFLPVVPGQVDVKTQVARLLGPGVDLRVCAVRPDYVGHALEEARHMDRICLLAGLQDPKERAEVDVLVPDGQMITLDVAADGIPMRLSARIEFLFDPDPDDLDDVTSDVLTLEGAARGELLAAGGAAFHFAGTGAVAEEVEVQPRDGGGTFTAGTAGSPAAGAAAGATFTARAADGTVRAASTRTRDATAARSLTGETIRRVFSRRSAKAAAGSTGSTGSGSTAGSTGSTGSTGSRSTTGGVTGFQEAPPINQPQAAEDAEPEIPQCVWLSARVEHNPFTLRPGDSTPVRADLAISSRESEEETLGVDVVLQGELFCDVGGNGAPFLQGRVRVFGVARAGGEEAETSFMTASVQLSMGGTGAGGGQLAVKVTFEERDLTATTTWSTAPIEGATHATIDWLAAARDVLLDQADTAAEVAEAERRAQQLAAQHPEFRNLPWGRLDFRHDPEVAQPGNPYHTRAVESLSFLESLLDDEGFRDRAMARLFPAPRPGEGGGTVRPRRDWVLFRRRRRSSCDCVCQPLGTLAQPILRYRVFHLAVPLGTTVDQARALVTGTTPLPDLETLPVVPRFDSGTGILRSSFREVREAWPQAAADRVILYGAVAARPSDDASPAILDERLERMASVFNDVSADAGAVYETLDTVPGVLDASGVDGVLVFVTHPEVMCHRVVGLEEFDEMDEVKEAADAGTGLEAVLASEGFEVGSVRFVRGTDGAVPGDLEAALAAWRATHQVAQPVLTLVLIPQALADTDITAYRQQGFAISQALGGRGSVDVRFTSQPVFGGCEVVTVLEPQSEQACHTVFGMTDGPLTSGGTRYARFRELMAQGNVSAATSLPGVQNILVASFQQGTATPAFTAASLRTAWTAKIGTGAPVNRASTVIFGNSVASRQTQEARTLATARIITSSFGAADATIAVPSASDGCGAVTVLVRDATPSVAATTCLRVLALPDTGMMDRVMDAARERRLATLVPNLRDLGSAAFQSDGTPDRASLEGVSGKWSQLFESGAGRAVLLTPGRTLTDAHRQQANTVVQTLGGRGTTETPMPSAEDVFAGCQGLVLVEEERIVVTSEGCQRVLRIETELGVEAFDAVRNALFAGGLDAVLAMRGVSELSSVHFAAGDARPSDEEAFRAEWQGSGTGEPQGFVSVVSRAVPEDGHTLEDRRSAALAELAGAEIGRDQILLDGETGGCPAATLLFVRATQPPDDTETTRTTCHSVFVFGTPVGRDGVRRIVDRLHSGGLDGVLAESREVGTVTFREGTMITDAGSLRQPAAVTLFSIIPFDADAGTAAAEAEAIAKEMGIEALPPVSSPAGLPGECGTVTLLITEFGGFGPDGGNRV